MRTEADIVVIGGGILGTGIAAIATQLGYSVKLLRLHDGGRPRADTLRNQGWLQSGLMYISRFRDDRNKGLILAKMMSSWGRRMLNELQLPLLSDSEAAVLCVRDKEEGEQLREDAATLRIGTSVRKMPPEEARRLLADFYEADSLYFTIPDRPFDEGSILTRLRQIALDKGAELLQLGRPISLVKDDRVPSGLHIDIEGVPLFPRVTILAAGFGNFELLSQLNIAPNFTLKQTPLLVVDDRVRVGVPIFAHRTRGFSFVHQSAAFSQQGGALVIGTTVSRKVAFCAPEMRRIPLEDKEKFVCCLPPALSAVVARGRFTAGCELIPDNSTGKSYLEPWVRRFEPEYPGLYFTSPGRATLGMYTAKTVVDDASRLLDVQKASQRIHSRDGEPSQGCRVWDDEIHMHFEPYYNFDDSDGSKDQP